MDSKEEIEGKNIKGEGIEEGKDIKKLNRFTDIIISKPKSMSEYTVIKQLGKGSFGTVSHVVRNLNNIDYVIKEISLDNVDIIETIFRETYIPKTLQYINLGCHPNITCLVNYFIEEDPKTKKRKEYFVYKYVDGVDLSTWLKRLEKEEKEYLEGEKIEKDNKNFLDKIWIASKFLDAFIFLKNIGVSHRDIKPSNIIISKYNNPVIIDFGLSCVNMINPNTDDWKKIAPKHLDMIKCKEFKGKGVGTLNYAAPELYAKDYKKNFIDYEHCDRYSIGITLADMFESGKIVKKLEDLINRLISFNPAKRPTLEESLSIMESILADEHVHK